MKESVRIFRFIVIGTMNALIMALVVWLMMKEISFDGDYMVANITAYLIAQISRRKQKEQSLETDTALLLCFRSGLHRTILISYPVSRRIGR